ncbi:hypothetical protein MMF93_20500 [Streptomyces tubbatahanensis]|uniref:Uncharacterized protein n=1 Tax=Streptomyces tubbatahanensis TaxID=2923272 RepID=A0ABY3XW85_9ACTN|nr:hypothetical protein [Streptomyces tubbatahanensis]UNS98571.1 hypothetical protein MMF93_20500 [Streptomyces tubbatahanensis]
MTSEPSNRQRIGMLIKRDLPDRAGHSVWCGKHSKERTVLVARKGWACLECIREQSR